MTMPLLTVAEAAALLRVSKRTVYRLIDREHLSATKVGAAWRIHREAVDNHLNAERAA